MHHISELIIQYKEINRRMGYQQDTSHYSKRAIKTLRRVKSSQI